MILLADDPIDAQGVRGRLDRLTMTAGKTAFYMRQ